MRYILTQFKSEVVILYDMIIEALKRGKQKILVSVKK